MAQALYGRDIKPDLIVGTSVGAINGSWLASGAGPAELAGSSAESEPAKLLAR